jgi:hypothetical protein
MKVEECVQGMITEMKRPPEIPKHVWEAVLRWILRKRSVIIFDSVVYWSEFLTTDPEFLPALPDFLRNSWSVEELLERKSRGYGLENRDYGNRGSSALTTRHLLAAKIWH